MRQPKSHIFVRLISSTDTKLELIGLLTLKNQTCGENVANAVIQSIEKDPIPLNKTGNFNHEILAYHFIIHEEALCTQEAFREEIYKNRELVIKIINFIIDKVANRFQF
ncbi:hypothetical protein RF11_07527 [Thelohanellus kitauei]|uniref:Uncharacterized protein n=1 Tax=Thelohanellus kitauei TaxID=669202 RepID=A0A0C2N006_THEKT|nr:hypothetical protein RF11_07527 [Thelohanellus kitauei]